jgi:hypothetical protein
MRKWIFEWLFSKLPPFSWINGNKTQVAEGFAYVFAIIWALQEIHTQFGLGVESLHWLNAQMGVLASLLGVEIGRKHKEDKGE